MGKKRPTSNLVFDKKIESRSISIFAKSYVPGKDYGLNYGIVRETSDGWETMSADGLHFAGQNNGYCQGMVVWPDGKICAATNTGKVVIMDDYRSDHVVTLEGGKEFKSWFFSAYYNGIDRVVVIPGYRAGIDPKNIFLSLDGGETFRNIKANIFVEGSTNLHFHDVEYDPYTGAIWASQGDGLNSNLYVTYDLGETWHSVIPDKSIATRHQPTLIHAFRNKVIFGEDASSEKPGLYAYEKQGAVDLSTEITLSRLFTFRPDKGAHEYFAHKDHLACAGDIAYISFPARYAGGDSYIYATGDGGDSWHLVWVGHAPTKFERIAIAGNYIMGVINDDLSIYCAKLLDWV